MSALVQAAATVAATPIPTVTPVVHAVVATHAVVTHTATNALNQIFGRFSTADLITAAGVISTALLAWLNKLPWLQHEVATIQDVRRFLVSIALPFAGTYVASLASGDNTLAVAPWIFAVSQVAFYVIKGLKYAGAKTVTPAVQDPAPQLATENPPAA